MARLILTSSDNKPLIMSSGELIALDWADWPSTLTVSAPNLYYQIGVIKIYFPDAAAPKTTTVGLYNGGVVYGWSTCSLSLHYDAATTSVLWKIRITRTAFPTRSIDARLVADSSLSPIGTYTQYSGDSGMGPYSVSA